ncbi:hypothetical protein ABH922_002585 [Rhodococcus sp. 27YEA15]|uniref:condensation domain-containing protein n=1 Tax=Rhodococcus sp. 27YEA15 TaxID=3156259 RepID=UPI003C7AEAF8
MRVTYLDRFDARPGRILQWTPTEIASGSTYPVPPISNQYLHLTGSRGDTTWLAATFDIRGAVDEEALGSSFETWAARHDALSCSFSEVEGLNQPATLFVDVADVSSLRLREVAVVDAPTPELVRGLLGERLDRCCNPFAFPAYFLGAISREDQSTVICGFDHSICDGWSMSIAIAEINALYRQYTQVGASPPTPDPLPEPGSFLNYCFRESATPDPEPDDPRIAGWRSFLRECGGDTPHFPLDLRLPTGEIPTQGTDTRLLLDAEEADRFDQNSSDHRHSSFSSILASVGLATTRLTGTADTRLLFPVHTRREPRHNHTFGWLVANAPITVTSSDDVHSTAQSVNDALRKAILLSSLSSRQVLRSMGSEMSPTRRDIFSVSYADYRIMPGGSRTTGTGALPTNPQQLSRISRADDVQFWFTRTHKGLAVRTRFPAPAAATVHKYLDVVVEGLRECSPPV